MKYATAIIKFSELSKGNKRMCLSAKRGLDRCHQCHHYDTCESKKKNPIYDKIQQEIRTARKQHEKRILTLNNRIERLK